MKTVYFIRHAKSSWKDPELDDIDRPLNKRGRRDAPFMGELLYMEGVRPDKLLTSPANRALTTARFFLEALHLTDNELEVIPRIYEAYPEDVMEVIRSRPESEHTIMVFGHNPTFTALANRFSTEPIINVPTCGIFRVDSDAESWTGFGGGKSIMTEFHRPKQYFS